jgi:transcriptional regulator with XRE-family HTH domain
MARKSPALVAFGSRVRALREKKGFTQESFATKIDMDGNFYALVERGERNLSLLKIVDIAEGLGVDIRELFRPPRKPRK